MTATSATLVGAFLVLAALVPLGMGFSPSIVWSPHLNGMKEMVEYQILSPKDLTNYVMNKGGWSEYLCSRGEAGETLNFVLLFIGKELESLDVSRIPQSDQAIVHFLKVNLFAIKISVSVVFRFHFNLTPLSEIKHAFSNSNSSLAFPYVTPGSEGVAIENTLVSEFEKSRQHHNFGSDSFTLVGSCNVDGEKFNKLQDIHAVHSYMDSRMKTSGGKTELLMLCNNGGDIDQHSESSILSQLVASMADLGAKYSILYVSDPFKSAIAHHGLERFLVEGPTANSSSKSTLCDAVCQIKSSLLEGILVGFVLLVILISGLCCMMGIDTPTRFETPQDS